MRNKTLLNIPIPTDTKPQVLDKILINIKTSKKFLHIINLNPEILVLTQENYKYKKIVATAQIKIIDGIGVLWASRIKGIQVGNRISGIGLVENLLQIANKERLRVMFLGGGPKVAERAVECQSKIYPKIRFEAIQGISSIAIGMTKNEKKNIISIVRSFKPHLLFVGLPSPYMDIWIYENKKYLQSITCMGVGGSLDFLSGRISRAPYVMQRIGLEWFYRLIQEPWRWRRQLRLIKFVYLVLTK